MIILDERDKRPIYEQVTDRLSELIARGVLKTGEGLPSVRSFATELSINPNTVQKAYLELERRGYIYSVKGKGSFVADPEKVLQDQKDTLMRDLDGLCKRAKDIGVRQDELTEGIKRSYGDST